MKLSQESKDYISLLESEEDWLIRRVSTDVPYPDPAGYMSLPPEKQSFPARELIRILIGSVKASGINRPGQPDLDLNVDDQATAFGLRKAYEFRVAGSSLHGFRLQARLFRQAFNDLFSQATLDDTRRNSYIAYTNAFFDRTELGFIAQWLAGSPLPAGVTVTENHQALQAESTTYRSVFEGLYTPLILLDESGKIQNFNLQATQLFEGLQRGSCLLPLNHIACPGLHALAGEIEKAIGTGKEVSVADVSLDTRQGNRYFKIIVRRLLSSCDSHRGTIVMLEDLTENHLAEEKLKTAKQQAEEADRLKTFFLANMSHEIRTPMNAIAGFAELLLNGNYRSTEQMNFLKLIHSSSKDLLHIIEDIIDIAKLESKQLKIKYNSWALYDIFTNLHAIFSDTLRRYGIHEDVELLLRIDEKDKKLTIFTDGERLKQVLSNFLSNAAKFTNKGQIEFGYRLIDDTNILFFVRDTGAGIPEELKEKIFDRFFQVDEHQPMNHGGSGLGLAICKNIVHLMGGRIWVESTPGKGSTFLFQLPCRIAEPELSKDHKASMSQKKNESFSLKGKKILIAEDDDISYMLLRESLIKTETEIIRARNGLEAINIAESLEKLDLVLMDMKMPGINGFEAARYISAIHPELPIIAQTAFAMEGDRLKCLEAGCCDYVTKPVNSEKLTHLLERYLSSESISRGSLIGAK